MKTKLNTLLLSLCLLLAAGPAAAAQVVTPDPSTMKAEGSVAVDMHIDEHFVVVIPGALTIAPASGGREYAVGDVQLTEVHLLDGHQLALGLPQEMTLASTVRAGSTLRAAPFIGSPGSARQSQTVMALGQPVPVSLGFAPYAFADAVAGQYKGVIQYHVWIENTP